jgi:hypothetical protein
MRRAGKCRVLDNDLRRDSCDKQRASAGFQDGVTRCRMQKGVGRRPHILRQVAERGCDLRGDTRGSIRHWRRCDDRGNIEKPRKLCQRRDGTALTRKLVRGAEFDDSCLEIGKNDDNVIGIEGRIAHDRSSSNQLSEPFMVRCSQSTILSARVKTRPFCVSAPDG